MTELASFESAPPVLVRVAGLPASALDGFGGPLLAQGIDEASAWEEELSRDRAALVEILHSAVHGAPAELRRYLLAVKRDAFNGRSLTAHLRSPFWNHLLNVAGSILGRIVELEARLDDWWRDFEAAWETQTARERKHLLELLEKPGLLRGIALGIPLQLHDLGRLRACAGGSRPRQRERKLEIALLRYVSRAARKLSPYSTLTRLGVGTLQRSFEQPPLRLLGHGWRERSRLRLKRFVPDQVRDALFLYAPFRTAQPVLVNETLEEVEPGRFQLLRPGHWELEPKSKRWRFVPDALITTRLSGPLVARLQVELAPAPKIYRELAETLEQENPGRGVATTLDKLLEIGFLRFVLPWAADEEQPERRLLELLRSLPDDEGLARVLFPLERLVALANSYATAPDPAGRVREIDRLVTETWDAAAQVAGIRPESRDPLPPRGRFYEDVFLLPEEGAAPDIAQVAAEGIELVARSLQPLARLSHLFNHRYDFLHTLSAFALQRWPGRTEVGLLELFEELQPLWRDYLTFLASTLRPGGWKASFDPLALPQMDELRRLREHVRQGFSSCVLYEEGEHRLCGRSISALLQDVPEPYQSSPVGACWLLQPADPAGLRWVLNRMYEGTGRYGSRFTLAMDEGLRGSYADHFAACSSFDLDGERVELLDLLCAQGDTLNAHAVQTPRVLEIPGEVPDLPAARRVRLRDLRIRLQARDGLPRLVDASGRQYLPVHLGGANNVYMPVLVRFLALLGPGEFRAVFPERPSRKEGEIRVWDRLTMGDVVLMRRRWYIPRNVLAEKMDGRGDAEAFVAVDRWRRSRGIPERVFLLERFGHHILGERSKPQYLDLGSPLFFQILRSAAFAGDDHLIVEEILPGPEALPQDPAGASWAVEILLDSLALGRNRGRNHPEVFSATDLPLAGRGGLCQRPEPMTAR